MADWLYLMTTHTGFPEPLGEISFLAALFEEDGGGEVLLLLADRAHPPMSTAQAGQTMLLCTRDSTGLMLKHAIGRVAAAPTVRTEVPAALRGLYPTARNRWFVPLSEIAIIPTEPVSELTSAEQLTMASGQAYVRRLKNQINPPRGISRRSADRSSILTTPSQISTRPQADSSIVVVGLDPTAGTWPDMIRGPKPMPSVALRMLPDGTLRLHKAGVVWHESNSDFWRHVSESQPRVTCIDGPCATAGPRVLPDWSGWDPLAPDGVRTAERELTTRGINLFWTTRATVMGFPGASRWIARSLRLFQEAAEHRIDSVIETHPFGVFVSLWRNAGHTDALPRKTSPAGRACRLALLQAWIPSLDSGELPDHDAVDAAAAAVLAAFHARGRTTGYGSAETGGVIWLPTAT